MKLKIRDSKTGGDLLLFLKEYGFDRLYFSRDRANKYFTIAWNPGESEAGFMYASHDAFYAKCFVSPITDAAWRHKPSFGIVATDDKSIVPDIQRNMYKRSNTKIAEIKGSHAVYISQPEKVGAVIIEASRSLSAH